jgi:four helix bundle protein
MQPDKSKFKEDFKKRRYQFTLKLIRFLDSMPKDNVSLRLGDQLWRSGTSSIGNYVEARAASSRKDFTNFLNTALKSANESKLRVALLRDSGRAKAEDAAWFLRELEEVANILTSSVLTLKGKR